MSTAGMPRLVDHELPNRDQAEVTFEATAATDDERDPSADPHTTRATSPTRARVVACSARPLQLLKADMFCRKRVRTCIGRAPTGRRFSTSAR